jgi:putative nucleotidyltransferase with HDIG domain
MSLPPSELELGARRSAVVARLSKLPPFHPAAVKLLTLTADSDPSVKDFEKAFGADPVLASDLLVMANSPLYGLRSRIDNLRHAIALLGLDTVRTLALTVALGAYVRSVKARRLVRPVWAHSLATALIAEAIGKAQGEPGPSLYTAGLMHDIGRFAMLNLEGDRYAEVLEREYYEVEESLLLESLVFGCAHDDAGAFLTRSWGFPDSISECVRFHHQAAVEKGPALGVVRIACQYAGALDFGEVNCANHPPARAGVLPPALRGVPQLEPARVAQRIAQAEAEFTGILAAPPAGPRFDAGSSRAPLARKVG